MKVAIMQPYFMPYLGYFQAISAVDKYILYDQVSFIVKGWVNKNRIRPRNSNVMSIMVPIRHKSSFTLIKDTRIDYSECWQKRMINTIRNGYAKADYYAEVMPLIENILTQKFETISELNSYAIRKICEYLDIHTEIVSDCYPYEPVEEKLRLVEQGDYSALPFLLQTAPIKKVARVIALCKMENANHYINAIGGVELYDKEEFAHYGIKIEFIKMDNICYSQKCKDNSFEPNLSIIDVLMHNGKEQTKKLLQKYTLV